MTPGLVLMAGAAGSSANPECTCSATCQLSMPGWQVPDAELQLVSLPPSLPLLPRPREVGLFILD